MDGWDVAEQAAILIADDLYLASLEGIGPASLVYRPAAPGLHLIQVLARGRAAHYDAVVDEATEDYDITITPITPIQDGKPPVATPSKKGPPAAEQTAREATSKPAPNRCPS